VGIGTGDVAFPICLCVFLYVRCIVAKQLIRSRCHLAWWVGWIQG